MKINTLLKKLNIPKIKNNFTVTGISSNSKEIKENFIFVAVKGYIDDGNNYINEALNNGAKLIISEEYYSNDNYIKVDNSKETLALLLYNFYYSKLKHLYFIGVTGTNGKTSTSTLIYDYLKYNHKKCVLIGSNGIFTDNLIERINNTTPNIEKIYEFVNYAYNFNYQYIIIEISSVALSEYRVKYIPFNIAIFTNFSLDHIDYHKTLDNYFNAKLKLFKDLGIKSFTIVNKDDSKSIEIINNTKAKVITYGTTNADIIASNIKNKNYLSFMVNDKIYKTNLIGFFNIYNILPLFGIKSILKLKKCIFQFLILSKPIPGRMNLFIHNNKSFLIDYAHTPKALENVLDNVKSLYYDLVYVIIGCGGSRDISKRKIIGEILNRYNYNVILTSDNPRYEDEYKIIKDIEEGLSKEHLVILDRKEAIKCAYNNAKSKCLILVIGKGIENYIEKNGIKIKYNDYDYINSLN